MTVLKSDESDQTTYSVKLDKGSQQSFGICIVRGEVSDSPTSKISGIFIKDIIPQTPAHLCGKLKIGDRILTLNDKDVRNANEAQVVNLIRLAGTVIDLQVQTINQNFQPSLREPKPKAATENGFVSNGEPPSSKSSKVSSNQNESSKPAYESPEGSDDEVDTRDMTGRIYTDGGVEIDRASAGNVKRSSAETAADKEEEDEFGYTARKIKKRYGKLGPVHKTQLLRSPGAYLGLALSGHKDRNKMACMVAGVNPSSIIASCDIKPGDEILEINGNVVLERCHLNATQVFKNIAGDKLVFIVLRHKVHCMASKPVQRFPAVIDETEYLFTQYKNVRKVQVQKVGSSLGIMIIEGKHAEIGAGIFISDIQAGSNSETAGLRVGEMLLAINKDVLVDTNYDSAAATLKRAEGVVTLIVCSAKSAEELAAEEEAEKIKKEEAEKKKAEEAAKKKELEKPVDPSVAPIKPNQKTLIELKAEKKCLGCMVVGGKKNYVSTGIVITHIYPEGIMGLDKRLQPFDQVLEFNGNKLEHTEMTQHKVYELFNLEYQKVTMIVWRNDPIEVEEINIDVARKPGKDLGLAMVSSPKGVMITNIISAGCADIDSRLQRGDIINKINGESLEGAALEECYALFRAASGKTSLGILRPKPTNRA